MVLVAAGKGGWASPPSRPTSPSLSKARRHRRLLDADIYGPSVPIIMGVKDHPEQIPVNGGFKLKPPLLTACGDVDRIFSRKRSGGDLARPDAG